MYTISISAPSYKGIYTVKFSSNGKYIVSGGNETGINLWDIKSGRLLKKLHKGITINSVSMSRDGKYILSGGEDGSLHVWDIVSGECIQSHSEELYSNIDDIEILFDDDTVVYSHGVNLSFIQLSKNKKIHTIDIRNISDERYQECTYISVYNKYITFGHKENVFLCSLDGTVLQKFVGHNGNVVSTKIASDGLIIASSSADKSIILWDAVNGDIIHQLYGHKEVITSIVFSKDEKYLISTSKDQTIRLWDCTTGEQKHIFKMEKEYKGIYDIDISPNGKYLISGGGDGIVKLWDIESGEILIHFIDKGYGEWISYCEKEPGVEYYNCSENSRKDVFFYNNIMSIFNDEPSLCDKDNKIYTERYTNILLDKFEY